MLKQLKKDTASLHDQVEEAMNSTALLSQDYSQAQYMRLLKQLYQAHCILEPLVYEQLRDGKSTLDLNYRLHKRSLLRQDLEQLGAEASSCSQSLKLENPSQAWGVFYVLEGSSLGAAMIHHSLRKRQWPENILNFYGYYGSDTGNYWQEFRQVFKQLEENGQLRYEEVLTGANKAYQVFLATARN